MRFNKLSKSLLSTFNKPSILQNLRDYKNSLAQKHLHNYIRDDQELQKIKEQKIDYDFITRQSNGVLMFREFSFQQKTQQTLVPHLNCQLGPTGAWAYEEVLKQIDSIEQISKTEEINSQIMQQCQTDIQKAIKKYYVNIGKKNYQFNLSEEINKINQMTDEEFRHFAKIVHYQKGSQKIEYSADVQKKGQIQSKKQIK